MLEEQLRRAQKYLAWVSENEFFYCRDGQILKCIDDLERALRTMDRRTFFFHSLKERSDFALWTEHSIGHRALAKALEEWKKDQTKCYEEVRQERRRLDSIIEQVARKISTDNFFFFQ